MPVRDGGGEAAAPGVERFRAFIALPVPPHPEFASLLAELKALGVKTAAPDQLHVTLSFLGDVPASSAPRLASGLDDATRSVASFSLTLRGVGAFPDERHPRVVWIGVQPERRLDELARQVRARLPPSDAKPFRAHATLGRADERAALGGWLQRHIAIPLVDVKVTEVRLYRSTLEPSGARHEIVHASPLEA